MENNYFTPNIEDIRVGYECEYMIGNQFTPIIVKQSSDLTTLTLAAETGILRVPYLTKEQIEAEGWIFKGGQLISDGRKDFIKNGINLSYIINKKFLTITIISKSSHDCNIEPDIDYVNLYRGECKDINTFKYIIKLLGI